MKKMRKIKNLLLAMVLSFSAMSLSDTSNLEVSARADGRYCVGTFKAEVSEYLTLRQYASPSSRDMGHIPANSILVVEEVSGRMGRITEYYKPNSKGGRDRVVKEGWVNLNYADETYDYDVQLFSWLSDDVPVYYDSVTWRSKKDPYSAALDYLYYGFKTYRTAVGADNKIDENDKMARYSTYGNTEKPYACRIGIGMENKWYRNKSYCGVGYYNLDYMYTEGSTIGTPIDKK